MAFHCWGLEVKTWRAVHPMALPLRRRIKAASPRSVATVDTLVDRGRPLEPEVARGHVSATQGVRTIAANRMLKC